MHISLKKAIFLEESSGCPRHNETDTCAAARNDIVDKIISAPQPAVLADPGTTLKSQHEANKLILGLEAIITRLRNLWIKGEKKKHTRLGDPLDTERCALSRHGILLSANFTAIPHSEMFK